MSGPLARMVRAKYPGAYDDMTDEQLEQAVTAKYPGVYDDLLEAPKPPAPAPRGLLSPSTLDDFPVVNMARGAANVLKSLPGALYDLAADVAPYDAQGNLKMPMGNTVQAIWDASGNVMAGARDAYQQGDYLTAARKGINTFPVVGPMLDASADKMMQGNVAEGIGEVVTNAALMAAGARPKAPPRTMVKPPRMRAQTNPVETDAVAFARREGIPLDVGTATGSNFIKTVQELSANTYGGARTAERLQQAQREHLARVGNEQVGRAAPNATNPVAAGEGVRNAITRGIESDHATATAAYDTLRAIEQQKPARPPAADALTALDASQRIPLAVDITQAVKELQPLYTQLLRESELGIPMHGAKGKTLAALDGLMNAPNWAPLSVVDGALSDLKAMARGADMPELRTTGQATAAQAVTKLDAQVRAAAARHGQGALRALEEGRAATRAKYAKADVLDMLSGEPGQVYRQLTQAKDVGLERLRAVERIAPQELPNIGRAFLEDAMQQATAEGGFMHADRLWSNWQKLGGESKRRMFSQQQIYDLDNFFLIGKRINEIKNPSGTAKVFGVLDLATGIPAWALSKMLMTPNGVRWLTEARTVSRSQSPAARALAVTNITRAAQSAGVPLEMIPAFGEDDQRSTPSQTRTSGARR